MHVASSNPGRIAAPNRIAIEGGFVFEKRGEEWRLYFPEEHRARYEGKTIRMAFIDQDDALLYELKGGDNQSVPIDKIETSRLRITYETEGVTIHEYFRVGAPTAPKQPS